MSYAFPHNNVISNEGLNCLQQTFDNLCETRQIIRSSATAEDGAGRLMDWYQLGITDPNTLARLIDAV
jgi:hypothetical protein